MPGPAAAALVLVGSYLLGSIPFGWILARVVAGVDVRTVGSGNVGATNVARVLGRRWFIVVFALDAVKGAAAVAVLAPLAGTLGSSGGELLRVGCAMAAVLGHVFSVFLRFKGGKGVATSAGVLVALAPLAAASALGVFLVVLLVFRYVSLGSVCAAVSLGPLAYLLGGSREVVVFAVLVAALVVVRHRANLARIAAGTEPRALQRKEAHGG